MRTNIKGLSIEAHGKKMMFSEVPATGVFIKNGELFFKLECVDLTAVRLSDGIPVRVGDSVTVEHRKDAVLAFEY